MIANLMQMKQSWRAAPLLPIEENPIQMQIYDVGSYERTVTSDIADIQEQIAMVANDPNLTIVTENVFYYGM